MYFYEFRRYTYVTLHGLSCSVNMSVNISKLSVVTSKGAREVALGGPKGDPGVSDLAA